MQQIGCKNTILKRIEDAHDARHVDPLLVGLQRNRSSDRGFKHLRIRSQRDVTQRKSKIRYTYLQDWHIGAEDLLRISILHIG